MSIPSSDIPFSKPTFTGRELDYVRAVLEGTKWSGNGSFTAKCHEWLKTKIGCHRAIITHSGTAALEMAALLCEVGPGDEVIMPSYTFVSTANAFVLRGATPVFVDIKPDTLNIDEDQALSAITSRTRALVPVHYAGVASRMDEILEVANRHRAFVIADAAQAMGSRYKGRDLASLGHLSTVSFHDTKNVSCGEGGALVINDPQFAERAEILWEKGTNRSLFLRGQVDRYTWVDIGSSFLPSEITAAILFAQLQEVEQLTLARRKIWNAYYERCEKLEARGMAKRPALSADSELNAHIFYLILDDAIDRNQIIEKLKEHGITASSHYVPLHSSPAGRKYGRAHRSLVQTERVSRQILRLPLWPGFQETDRVVELIEDFCL